MQRTSSSTALSSSAAPSPSSTPSNPSPMSSFSSSGTTSTSMKRTMSGLFAASPAFASSNPSSPSSSMSSLPSISSLTSSSTTTSSVAALFPMTEELEHASAAAIQALEKKQRGRECLEALRQLHNLLASSTKKFLPSRPLITSLSTALMDPKLSSRLRVLCLSIMQFLVDEDPEAFRAVTNRLLLQHLMPLSVSVGSDAYLARNIPTFIHWISSQDAALRPTAFPALLTTARKCGLQHSQVRPVEKHMSEWLLNARNAEQKDSGFFGFSSKMPVLELNGVAAQSFFTSLNIAGQYSDDQMFNIFSFSNLHSWLHVLYATPHPTDDEEQPLEVSANFRESVVRYCTRLVEQARLKTGSDTPFKTRSVIAADLPEIGLVEAIRILDLLSRLDPSQLPRLFPIVQKVSGRSKAKANGHVALAVLQFFTNHCHLTSYSPEPFFKSFLDSYLSSNINDSVIAFETLNFFLNNRRQLLQYTNIFTLYFPPLLKLVAWFPDVYHSEFLELLPALVGPTTFLELFHSLLDLPLLTAALERIEYEKRQDVEASGRGNEFRVLYNYVLRNESGVSINFWESSTTFDKLQEFCRVTPITARVMAVGGLAPALLEVYFDVLTAHAPASCLRELLPVIFQRIQQLFPLERFQQSVRSVLVAKAMAIFQKFPEFVVTFKELIVSVITDGTHAERRELVLSLCWIVGEYASPTVTPQCTPQVITEYHEALETFAYERMSFAKLGIVNHPAMSGASGVTMVTSGGGSGSGVEAVAMEEGSGVSPKDDVYTTRLMMVTISALAKLAARWQDLSSRVIICLAKVLRHGEYFHPSVLHRANECIRILKFPSIASAILDTPLRTGEEARHTDKNSSLPFLLLPTTYVPGMQPMHEFELLAG